jgi:hypothetical protein
VGSSAGSQRQYPQAFISDIDGSIDVSVMLVPTLCPQSGQSNILIDNHDLITVNVPKDGWLHR